MEKKIEIEVRELAEQFFDEQYSNIEDPARKIEVKQEYETWIACWMKGYRAAEKDQMEWRESQTSPRWVKAVVKLPQATESLFVKIEGKKSVASWNPFHQMFVDDAGDFHPADQIEWLDEPVPMPVDQDLLQVMQEAEQSKEDDLKAVNKAIDEFAGESDAVEFHEWAINNAWELDHREEHTHTASELYTIFKQQKL